MHDDKGSDSKLITVPDSDPRWSHVQRAVRRAGAHARRDRALLLDLQGARGQEVASRAGTGARGAADRRARAGSAGRRRAADAGRRAPGRCRGVRAPHRVVRRRTGRCGGRARTRAARLRALGGQAAAGARRVRAGVLEASASARALALACASHGGSAVHVGVVAEVLEAAGLAEGALGCGPELPRDPREARGVAPRPIRHNCSGKHAFGLARCLKAGLAARRLLPRGASAAGRDARLRRRGVRGRAARRRGRRLGMRTFAVPLGLAGAFAGLASGARPVGHRCASAMRARPTGRLRGAIDTELMRAEPGLVAKIGAEGLAMGLPDGRGLALKVRDGATRAVGPPGSRWPGPRSGSRPRCRPTWSPRRSATRAGCSSASCAPARADPRRGTDPPRLTTTRRPPDSSGVVLDRAELRVRRRGL